MISCPLACIADPQADLISGFSGGTCERPCASNTDCPSPLTACQPGCAFSRAASSDAGCSGPGAICEFNLGEGDAGCRTLGAVCNTTPAEEIQGGTCVYYNIGYCFVPPSLVCQQAGIASTSCDPSASRSMSERLCPPAKTAFPFRGGWWRYRALCRSQTQMLASLCPSEFNFVAPWNCSLRWPMVFSQRAPASPSQMEVVACRSCPLLTNSDTAVPVRTVLAALECGLDPAMLPRFPMYWKSTGWCLGVRVNAPAHPPPTALLPMRSARASRVISFVSSIPALPSGTSASRAMLSPALA